ncbi:type I-F CRISPR-associated protein Csy2 [Endozoicomonas sp. ONNA2]|uniref:type I-F CRISPR-associated protein Csy2 n=1 Tax=Endozoicomonas sp. ONNA2 TaxID=2828741 RepID=UPI00214731A7|nr:type I-F CRISPR-associated protein Csy2 [Endozoicomonas sp. ONNA2]
MNHAGYLLLPDLRLENINAEACLHVAGLPSITAFTGFAHALQLNWLTREVEKVEGDHLAFHGVAIIGHDLALYDGQAKSPPALHGMHPTKPEDMNPSIIQEMKGDLNISLILKIIQEDDEDEECLDNIFSHENLQGLAAFLTRTPLAGGRIIKQQLPVFAASSTALAEKIQRLPAGWLLCNAKEQLESRNDDPRDNLDRLLDALAGVRGDDGKYHRQQPGWLIPTSIGYRLLEPPTNRPGTRKQLPMAFAEPVISLAQWRYLPSLVHATNALDLRGENALWRHTYSPTDRLCVVDTHTN